MVNAKTLDLGQMFSEEYIITAKEVFQALDCLEEEWANGSESYSRAYCDRVVRLVREFRQMLQKHILFDCPPWYWGYSIVPLSQPLQGSNLPPHEGSCLFHKG